VAEVEACEALSVATAAALDATTALSDAEDSNASHDAFRSSIVSINLVPVLTCELYSSTTSSAAEEALFARIAAEFADDAEASAIVLELLTSV